MPTVTFPQELTDGQFLIGFPSLKYLFELQSWNLFNSLVIDHQLK